MSHDTNKSKREVISDGRDTISTANNQNEKKKEAAGTTLLKYHDQRIEERESAEQLIPTPQVSSLKGKAPMKPPYLIPDEQFKKIQEDFFIM